MENRIVTAVVAGLTVASVWISEWRKGFAGKMRFLAALEEYATDMPAAGDSLVLCGDVNIARTEMDVHPKERMAVIGQLPIERTQFERLLAAGLIDVGQNARS